jgi:hypothetical protein
MKPDSNQSFKVIIMHQILNGNQDKVLLMIGSKRVFYWPKLEQQDEKVVVECPNYTKITPLNTQASSHSLSSNKDHIK